MSKFIVLAALVAVVTTAELAAYPKTYEYPTRPYNFAYTVKDAPSYNDFGHQESSDGKVVTGSYRVALPDGRTQIVTYKADQYGYVADVKYEGEARYPEYKAAAYPKPIYPKPTVSAYPTYPKPSVYPSITKPAYVASPGVAEARAAVAEPTVEVETSTDSA